MMAELPAQREALRRAVAELPVEKAIDLMQVATEVLHILERLWQGTRRQNCSICEYSPEVVRYHLDTWKQLEAGADGVSAAGAEPIGSNGEVDARRTIIAIKADLELATDKAFVWGPIDPETGDREKPSGRYLTWESVRRIYRRQGRSAYWYSRRLELTQWIQDGHTITPKPEPPLAEAEGYCIELISRELGWVPHECEQAA